MSRRINFGEPVEKEPDSVTEKRPVAKIREMVIDDIPIVFHMGEELFRAQDAPNMYRTWDTYEVVGLFNSDTEFCIVAELDDDIIGFALGTTIEKSHSAWKYGHLIWLGVKPAYQRKGIAEKLFRRFKDIMLKNDVRMLMVDTQAENLPALHLFRKLGFGQPQEHIYLTMNVAAEHQRMKKRENGMAPPRLVRKNDA